MITKIKCDRCNGSGEVGTRSRGTKEVPGPVPEDARGWNAVECYDCKGEGEFTIYDDDDNDDETIPRIETKWVISGPVIEEVPLYWSSVNGWTDIAHADQFDHEEKPKAPLPRGGSWIEIPLGAF